MGSTNIEDILTCYICFERLEDPCICQKCTKLSCYKCLKNWHNKPGNENCPHCRRKIRNNQIIKCFWAEELTSEFQEMQDKLTNLEEQLEALKEEKAALEAKLERFEKVRLRLEL